jgi:uncharacterized membrane protein YgcG
MAHIQIQVSTRKKMGAGHLTQEQKIKAVTLQAETRKKLAATHQAKEKETSNASTLNKIKTELLRIKNRYGIRIFIYNTLFIFYIYMQDFVHEIASNHSAAIFSLVFLAGNFTFFIFLQKKNQLSIMEYVIGKSRDFPLSKKLRLPLFPISIFILCLRAYTNFKRRLMIKKGLSLLQEEAEDSYLSPSQITEEKIGSVEYDVYVDPEDKRFSIEKNVLPLSKFKKCEKCLALADYLEKDLLLIQPTYSSTGVAVKHYHCHHCDCRREECYEIPLKQSSSSSGSSSSSSSGRSSSGGNSFGGGRSGGGGAGGSW